MRGPHLGPPFLVQKAVQSVTSVHDSYEIDLLPGLEYLEKIDIECDTLKDGSPGSTPVRAFFFSAPLQAGAPGIEDWDLESLTRAGFTADLGKVLLLPSSAGATTVLFGLGDNPDADAWREAGASLARACKNYGAAAVLPPNDADLEALVEGVLLGAYDYSLFKSKTADTPAEDAKLRTLRILLNGADEASLSAARDAVRRARAYARSAYVARDLVNAPPAHLNPARLAKCAMQLADAYGFEVDVTDSLELAEMGCGGIIGVNRGSEYSARLIRLRYCPTGVSSTSRALAMVGKGITFDSGGMSLKPAASMLTMKTDMGGAAAILGAFCAFGDLGTAVPVEGWLPTTDNMISGDAMRVGEVITARNGTTVEVTNTDAEGRLVLMDALCLAVEREPLAIVDIATLTGAQITALGNDVAAIMGNDEDLLDQVERAADATGEDVWELPLHERYRNILDSEVADIMNANLSDRSAGTIVAGLFLSNFVEDTPWVHIDIAGPSFGTKSLRWLPVGATGFGARLLADLAKRYEL